jgi:hypothetical protein
MMFDPFSLKLASEHLRTELEREADAERLAAQVDQPRRPRAAWLRLPASGVRQLLQALRASRSALARSS